MENIFFIINNLFLSGLLLKAVLLNHKLFKQLSYYFIAATKKYNHTILTFACLILLDETVFKQIVISFNFY